jgi:hypothetical protein
MKLFKSFNDGLNKLGNVVVSRIDNGEPNGIPMISIRIEQGIDQSVVQLDAKRVSKRSAKQHELDLTKSSHTALLNFLDNHQLVRRVFLPPIIEHSKVKSSSTKGKAHKFPIYEGAKSYPKVAIVDGGVSDIFGDWVEDTHNFLHPNDKDLTHGSFIAGLLVSGASLNGPDICRELDGCRIIDIDILPKGALFDTYHKDPIFFFDELEDAVRELKARTGVRIFNFSLNITEHVSGDEYSIYAQRLDKIAEQHDVLFVISAGNAEPINWRNEWPTDPVLALQILASSRNDSIKKPSESYRNLSVSALNPPNMTGIVSHALSTYSCRGPGLRIGLKPDLAHFGGAGTNSADDGHGLWSVDPKGRVKDGCGTSYAAPNVAKSLACLEHSIEGDVSRETLMALAVHHAKVPQLMSDKVFKKIAKDLVGFGMPSSSNDILEGSDSSITLVFANRVIPGKRMSFNFNWPAALVKNGKCRGAAKLSIVSTPPFNYKFEKEVVRVNIEAHLRQRQDDNTYKGKLSPIYVPEISTGGLYEKSMIQHSFKWSPVKVFEGKFPLGIGNNTDWRLDVEYLVRDGEDLPIEGVPFTVVLTIWDPKGVEPVFNSMRQTLQSTGVKILDIKTASRVIPRV